MENKILILIVVEEFNVNKKVAKGTGGSEKLKEDMMGKQHYMRHHLWLLRIRATNHPTKQPIEMEII